MKIPKNSIQLNLEIWPWTVRSDVLSIIYVAVSVGDYKLGALLNQGKTKEIYDLPDHPDLVLLVNKDKISAHNGVRMDTMEGKAAISNQTNGKVFDLLNKAGVRTAFIKLASDNAFLARKCEMVPIEWVTRRLATGSFLKRNPGVPEGFRFSPPKQETFFKDDANDDPQWSEEQIIANNITVNKLLIGEWNLKTKRHSSSLGGKSNNKMRVFRSTTIDNEIYCL